MDATINMVRAHRPFAPFVAIVRPDLLEPGWPQKAQRVASAVEAVRGVYRRRGPGGAGAGKVGFQAEVLPTAEP